MGYKRPEFTNNCIVIIDPVGQCHHGQFVFVEYEGVRWFRKYEEKNGNIKWLKNFLNDWRDELILVTHDRSFMNSVITHTLNIHRGEFKKTSGNTKNVLEKILSEEL